MDDAEDDEKRHLKSMRKQLKLIRAQLHAIHDLIQNDFAPILMRLKDDQEQTDVARARHQNLQLRLGAPIPFFPAHTSFVAPVAESSSETLVRLRERMGTIQLSRQQKKEEKGNGEKEQESSCTTDEYGGSSVSSIGSDDDDLEKSV